MAPSLLGVVKVVVFLVRAGRRGGGVGRAGEDGAAQQAEHGAHPAGVEREAEGHERLLPVGADGEPDGGHQTTNRW